MLNLPCRALSRAAQGGFSSTPRSRSAMKPFCLALFLLLVAGLALRPAPPDEARPVKPINLTVNTPTDEDDPFVGSNDLILYYSANIKGKWEIMFSRRAKKTAIWGKGEVLQDYIRTEVDDRSAVATTEDRFPQFLYYATKFDKEGKSFDLYVAVKQGKDKAFTEPRPVVVADTEDGDEMYPWLSADGKELYFSRKTKEGWRVFVARRANAVGALGFEEPKMLEELAPDFHHVCVTPDGKTMYLEGPVSKGRSGLYKAMRTAKGWNKPEPLTMLNDPEAPTGDRSPALSSDGKRLYFASDRPGGKGGLDLWVVETYLLKS
jgi:hypothetical protein